MYLLKVRCSNCGWDGKIDIDGEQSDSSVSQKLTEADTSWIVIGDQSNPIVRTKKEWVDEIIKACLKAGIPFWTKENLWIKDEK